MYPLYWTNQLKRVFLCVILMSLKECVWSYTDWDCIQKLQLELAKKSLGKQFVIG